MWMSASKPKNVVQNLQYRPTGIYPHKTNVASERNIPQAVCEISQ